MIGSRFAPTVAVLLALFAGSGCQRGDDTPKADLKGPVLADVAGTPIHELDLDVHLTKLFGDGSGASGQPEVRRQALESMVMGRVIAQAAEAELSATDRARVDAQVALYREQLLMTEYLRRHATPQPVTAQMVQDYYRNHLERFGGGSERTFEMIIAADIPAAPQRDAALEALRAARGDGDWPAVVERLRSKGLALEYRQGSGDDQVLPEALRALVGRLAVKEASEPGLMQRRPYIVRVVSEIERAPRPLSEVSAEIRRSLAPMQVKEAVQAVADPLMKNTKITYHEPDKGAEED